MAPKKKKAAAASADGPTLLAKTRTSSKGKGKNNAAASEEIAIEKEGAMDDSTTAEVVLHPLTENAPEPTEVVVTVTVDEVESEETKVDGVTVKPVCGLL